MKNKIKNLLTHPLVIVAYIMGFIVMLLFGMNHFLTKSGFYEENPLKLSAPYTLYEYGDFVSEEITDYFEVLDDTRLGQCSKFFSNAKDSLGHIPVGLHKASVKWKNYWYEENTQFTIEVQDTTFPEIVIEKEEVKVKYGGKVDLESNILSVKDPVEGDVSYEIVGEVNNKKAGSYTVEIIATDKHGNVSEKSFVVKVLEPSGYTYPIKYSDGSATITITKEWYGNSWNYIAHIQFSDYSRFGTAVGRGVYGGKETTSSAAKRLGALLTVNGCYSAPNLNYRVVRKGVIYNGANTNTWIPAVYSSHNGLLLSAWETGGTPGIAGVNLQSLVDAGKVTDTFNFGPPILVNGVVKAGSGGGRAQRTTIGTSGAAGDIWLVVSDGRYNDGVSAGPTYGEVASLLQSKGCTFAVPLDGGGSSTMVWKGSVLNAARGKQRAVVDFVYFK